MRGYRRKWDTKHAKHRAAKTVERRRTNESARAAHAATVTRYNENHPERRKAARRKMNLKVAYGITPEQWEEMFEAQGRCCAICHSAANLNGKRLHTDHCHTTGKVRGIICHHCNLLIGQARERVEILEAAIRYLKGEENRANPSPRG